MNPEVKELWVKALRSGDYAKGKGHLKYANAEGEVTYCCLGVLCELSPVPGRKVDGGGCFEFGSHVSYLDEQVMEWAGLDSANPKVPWEGGKHSLADINDASVATFEDIANLIEEHL